MDALVNKNILILGLGASGRAAARFLCRREAAVVALDQANTAALQREAAQLCALGVKVHLGATSVPLDAFDLAVLSPGVPAQSTLVREVAERLIPIVGELELGYQHSRCLNIAITGTNGKTTTTELV